MKALLIVDVQNDFLPGGALGVEGGYEIVPRIMDLARKGEYRHILASRDYHPLNHCSFRRQGGPWPDHCVRMTEGAWLDRDILDLSPIVVTKGGDPEQEAYSAFEGSVDAKERDLATFLRREGIDHIDVVGLATDYCVKATAMDAARTGITTYVRLECTRPVDVVTGMQAVAEMQDAGVTAI